MATGLTRLTVNLTPRADAALRLAAEISGDSKTDTVNRALQVYAFFLHEKQEGRDILVKNGTEALSVEFLL